MNNKIHISAQDSIIFAEPAGQSLSEEIAVRSRSLDFFTLGNMYLPNPDPVLKSQGKDIQVYTDLMIDDRVGGGMINRIHATLSLDWEIDKGKGAKTRQAKAIKEIYSRLALNRINEGVLRNARGFGFAPHEIVWGSWNGLTVPIDIIAKPQHWFCFGAEKNDLRFRSKECPLLGEELPPRKFLCPTNESSYANPYGLALNSRCFWPVIFKKGGWRFWVQFSEKFGQVWPIGKLPRSATPEQRSELLDILSQMVADGCAVIPDDGSIDFKESGSKGATSDLYRGIIAEANNAISTVWLGHAGAGEAVPGKLGSDKTATDVRDDLRDADKSLLEEFHNSAIDFICQINWGSADNAPRFSLWEEEDVDTLQAERDVNLTAAMEKSGLKLSRKYYIREYNLDEADIEDAPLVAPVAVQQLSASTFAEQPVQPIELLKERMAKETAGPATTLIDAAETLLDEVETLEEFRDRLIELYSQADPERLATVLAQMNMLENMAGRVSAES